MISDLGYALSPNMDAIGSKNDRSTFTFNTGDYVANNADTIINGNSAFYHGVMYYTWYAATAGEGKASDAGKTIDGSICPAGWRLPPNYDVNTGGQVEKSFGHLLATYNVPATNTSTNYTSILDNSPLNFVRSGRSWDGTIDYTSYGYWWSSTANSTGTRAYILYYNVYLTYPQGDVFDTSADGYHIRCVAL